MSCQARLLTYVALPTFDDIGARKLTMIPRESGVAKSIASEQRAASSEQERRPLMLKCRASEFHQVHISSSLSVVRDHGLH